MQKEPKSHTSFFAKILQLEEVKYDSENLENFEVNIEHTSSTNSMVEYYSILMKPIATFTLSLF